MNAPLGMDVLCKTYVIIREHKKKIVAAHEAEVAKLDEQLDLLASTMKDTLVATGGTSLKTPYGTVYAQTKTRFFPMDWGVFTSWVLQNQAVDLLEKRVAQGNMQKWLDENPTNPPPGIQAQSEMTVTVRKA